MSSGASKATLLRAATSGLVTTPVLAAERVDMAQSPTAGGAVSLQIAYARRADGASTAYGRTGGGPVLLIPPGLVSHLEWYETAPGVGPWLHALAEHRTLVLFDRHGCGLSDRDRSDFSAEDDMHDIEAVADAVAPGDLDVMGVSWGTHIRPLCSQCGIPNVCGVLCCMPRRS
jgi:hypothetical protein